MNYIKKIVLDYKHLHLIKDKNLEIDVFDYFSNSLQIRSDEEFKILKEFYEENIITDNVTFNFLYIEISKKLKEYGYDSITPNNSKDFLTRNYDDFAKNPKKYEKHISILCNDDFYFMQFIVSDKARSNILSNSEDVISKCGNIKVLYNYLKIKKNKQELEKRKEIILNHIKKNINIYFHDESFYLDFYSTLKKILSHLKQWDHKEWIEFEDYFSSFINKKNNNLKYINIYISYLVTFKKESKIINSIINRLEIDHNVLSYLINCVKDENVNVNQYLKEKIRTPMDAYIYIESLEKIDSKKVPEFILDLIASDYYTSFNFFLYHYDDFGRFYQLENRMLKEKDLFMICKYIINFVKKPWKKAEPLLKENNYYWEIYSDFINAEDKQNYQDPLPEIGEDEEDQLIQINII